MESKSEALPFDNIKAEEVVFGESLGEGKLTNDSFLGSQTASRVYASADQV